jgi:hypothetical protein
MKNLLILFPLLLLISCSVQKRKYQNGYYVDWHNRSAHKEKPQNLTWKNEIKPNTTGTLREAMFNDTDDREIIASANAKITNPEFKRSVTFFPTGDTCDVLVFKDGSEIKGKVKEIGLNEIKYKRCDSPDGPMYISKKSEIFMIKYANGTREIIKSEDRRPVQASVPPVNPYRSNKFRRETHPLSFVSLISGILSVIFSELSLAFIATGLSASIFALPVIAALIAILAGKTALNRIKAQPDIYRGKGMAVTGFIMGIVILSIFLLIFILAAVLTM